MVSCIVNKYLLLRNNCALNTYVRVYANTRYYRLDIYCQKELLTKRCSVTFWPLFLFHIKSSCERGL